MMTICIAAIDNCCAPMEVKCTLFAVHVAPLLLSASDHEAIQVPYTTTVAFLTDSCIFCSNFPAILCIISIASYISI